MASADPILAAPPPSEATSTCTSRAPSPKLPAEKPAETKMVDTYGNPFTLPDYTIKQIRDAIPAHCYERSALRGYGYVARDIFLITTTFYVFNRFVTPETVPSYAARFALWTLYTVLQGMFGTGIWILAHECGHQAFSTSKIINDATGWVLHSALLVPYFSWKISHGKHHKATGNLAKDMAYVPQSREVYASGRGQLAHQLSELADDTPIKTALFLIFRQLVGWQLYLMQNTSGHNNHEIQPEGRGKGKRNGFWGGVNHFNPNSPLYEAKDAKLILLSDIGLAITASVLYWVGSTYGLANLAVWYIVPYMWVNHWILALTYLQHTDPSLPHYHPGSWNFVRGAAATIDRDFGFIDRHLFHGIIGTHVLHHYVSSIPFYNAEEATEAIKPVMGSHYRADLKHGPRGFLMAMWKSARWCQWVEPTEGAAGEAAGVMFFRNQNGLGVPPAKLRVE
ncbi:fatty acid desaturase-domain-containing protein [Geopyxis carbonaria]|nr:fatty acid desaturase-domain-containing protein [Geopyxis carbonaria]